MAEFFATVAGHRVITARLSVPNLGAWFVDLDLDETPSISGKVDVTIGNLKMTGTIAPEFQASFGLGRKIRVVAGGYGWSKSIAAKSYHNDAGVKSRTVADDAARACGEQIAAFEPAAERLGADYVRRAGPGSVVLQDVAGDGVPWWVDLAGLTRAGPRPISVAKPGTFELLGFDGRARVAELAADDLGAIQIGSVIRDERLGEDQTVREIEIVVSAEKARIWAWCGGSSTEPSRLARAMTSIARLAAGANAGAIFGKWRYRVVTLAGDRVNLQAVRKAAGLPDVLPVTMRPGVAGAWAKLALGSEVLVEFVEGDPAQPIVSGFPAKGDGGFVPETLTLGAATEADAKPIARMGDSCSVFFPPLVPISGTMMGTPFTGVLTITSAAPGIIQSGTLKVKAGA